MLNRTLTVLKFPGTPTTPGFFNYTMAKSAVEKYQPGPRRSLLKSSFDLEAAKRNYHTLLQNLSAITITKDNVNDDQTKEGREVLKALTDHKDESSKEPLQWHKDIMSVYKELSEPIQVELDRIAAERKSVSMAMQREAAEQLAEQTRINNAKQAVIDFANKVANLVTQAKTDNDIVLIEKTIGSEKVKSTVYHEFLPWLIERCDALRPQIKTQKENIRALKKIEEDEKVALQSGNMVAATELMEKKEQMQQVIGETTIRIHEEAFNQATTIDIVAPEIAEAIPKGRTNWKWKIEDIKMLAKKMPHLVKMVPDEDAIDMLLATKRKDGSLDGKLEENWNGILFFNDKSFK